MEGLTTAGHLEIELPSTAGIAVHNVAPGQPANVHVLCLVGLVVDQQQRLLGGLVVARGGQRDAVVVVEVVVIVHVRFDTVEVDVHILKLLHEEVATSHALTARDRVALVCRGADQLEALLGHLQVLAVTGGLAQRGVHHSLDDVFLRSGGVQVTHQLKGLVDRAMAQVVYYLSEQPEQRKRNEYHAESY